jgi:hypothetical protein
MRALINQMQQIEAGQILAAAGAVSLIGFGLWAGAECFRSAVQLYNDLAGQRAKEDDNG